MNAPHRPPAEGAAQPKPAADAAAREPVALPAENIVPEDRSGGALMLAGVVVGALWAVSSAGYLFAEGRLGGPDAAGWLAAGFITVAPAVAFALLGAAAREIARFIDTANRLRFAAARLSAPVASAKADARSLAAVVSEQIAVLNKASEGALARLAAMDEVLKHHAESVRQSSGEARGEVDALIADLKREREAMTELSQHLNAEAKKISETIDKQSDLVRQTADLASAHADEGRSLLESSSKSLSDAAAAAQKSGERIAREIDEQLRDMEALVKALDERARKLEQVGEVHRENVRTAQSTAQELSLAADAGAGAMREAVDAAMEQARRLTDVIAGGAREAAAGAEHEIDRIRRAGQAAREAAEAASRALDSNAQAILERVEQVNAASFDAASRTDEAFELRIRAVERAIEEVDARLAELPRTAHERARQLKEALDDGLRVLDDVAAEQGLREPPPMQERRRLPERDVDGRRGGREREERRRPRVEARADLDDDLVRPLSPDTRLRDPLHEEPAVNGGDGDGWRWKDLLKGLDDAPEGVAIGDAVLLGLRRVGVDPGRAIDPDMTARIARARRRAGTGEARALVLDGALSDVRRTAAALASDPSLRQRAEDFLDDHGRLVTRAIDANDAGELADLLDCDVGRAYLLVDAALADV
jgi:methyl-accepting chemotaxis protein